MIRRLIAVLSVLTLAHLYVANSFYLATGWSGVWWVFSAIFIVELMMPLLRFKGESWRKAWPSVAPFLWMINLLSLLAIGGFSILFFFSVIRDLVLLAISFFVSPEVFAMISTFSLHFELWLALAVLIVGIIQALIGPGVKRVRVPLERLPEEFEGFRIVHVSDLHIGPTIGSAYVRNVVNQVNELEADMIALTGDITDGEPTELSAVVRELAGMQSTFGRFFVTGNHEYYHNAPAWIQVHEESGTRVLTNESHVIEKGEAKLAVMGVPDVSAHQFVRTHASRPELAAEGLPLDAIRILLAHQPASYKAAHAAGVDLQLSGHTHSGQFFPWNLVIGFFHDYYRGLNRFKNMWIYVNQGTGYWGPPLRTAVSAEVTLLTLVKDRSLQ